MGLIDGINKLIQLVVPGISLDLAKDSLVVGSETIQSHLKNAIENQQFGRLGINKVELDLIPDIVLLNVALRVDVPILGRIDIPVAVQLVIEDFQISSARQDALVRVGEVKVVGAVIPGKVIDFVVGYIKKLIVEKSEGLVLADEWPLLRIELSAAPQVKQALDKKLLGIKALDLVQLGPLAVEEGRLRVGVELFPKKVSEPAEENPVV